MPSVISATTTNGVAISPDNSGSLQLATNNGTTAVTIDTSQNLLVGTNTQVAGAKLTLSGSATLGSTYQQVITDGTRAVRLGANSTSAEIQSTGGVPLYLNYGGNDVVIVPQGSGNVGIGTTSPATKLHVVGNSAAIQASESGGASVRMAAGGSTGFFGTYSNHPLAFLTDSTERMRITSAGDLLVNTTAQFNNEKFAVYAASGDASAIKHNLASGAVNAVMIRFVNSSNGTSGSITSNGTSTAYSTSSDYRLKENIAPMQNALGVVAQLKPCTYTWKTDGSSGQGFIAHELQAVVPDCVTCEKDAVDAEGKPVYQGVDTSFLVATLTAAIQELKAELDTVKAELASTNLSLADAKAELNTLKNPPVEGTE